MSIFEAADDQAGYDRLVSRFTGGAPQRKIPVWCQGRPDLVSSIALADRLYTKIVRPEQYRHGVLLGTEELPDGLREMIRPLAARWADPPALDEMLSQTGEGGSLLIAGVYSRLTLVPFWEVVENFSACGGTVALLTGRDAASLSWFSAKQYARLDKSVTALGLFTATDHPAGTDGIQIFDDRRLDDEDIRSELLGGTWQRLLLQGHGRDDSINLAEFTICGLSEAGGRQEELLGPRCAYRPECYKPMNKLIRVSEIPAGEIVLSSCNNSPFADTAVYDPKYQLMLSAIDGAAKEVVAAPSVHDSARPENESWIAAALMGAPSASALNESIAATQPFPAFLQFGLGSFQGSVAGDLRRGPDELIVPTVARLTCYLSGGLLEGGDALRSRLLKLSRKLDQWISRSTTSSRPEHDVRRELTDDLQSLDHAVGEALLRDPDGGLSGFASYFADRSVVARGISARVSCDCGLPARQFLKTALVPTAHDMICTACVRCGDVAYRMPGAPELTVRAPRRVSQGDVMRVRIGVASNRAGRAAVVVTVPRYLRSDCAISPGLKKIRVRPAAEQDVNVTIKFAEDVPAQAYYFSVIAVQDLALSRTRWDFGVVPDAASPDQSGPPGQAPAARVPAQGRAPS